MKIAPYAFALLATTLAATLPAIGPAAAANYRYASAGAACHAANGALASKFTFNLNYLTNVGTTDANVICSLPMDDATATPDTLTWLSVSVLVPTQGATVTCMAQTGYFFNGVNTIYRSSAQTYTATQPNVAYTLQWNSYLLERADYVSVLTINCKLPPGTKLGLIQRVEAPSS
jgi:hypothetical protein